MRVVVGSGDESGCMRIRRLGDWVVSLLEWRGG